MTPWILYEDNHIIAVNKKPSDLSQSDRTGDESLDSRVKAYLAEKYNKKGDVFLGIVHRLDRPVGGVLLYARTSKALARLNELFRTRDVKKIYWAIVREKPPLEEGTLTHYLKKVKGSRMASLSYRILGRSERYYLIEIDLQSGRHHQIRAQLSAIGCPVKGDLKYGYPRSNEDGSISLISRKIEFVHPVKKEKIILTAPLPETDVWQAFRNII